MTDTDLERIFAAIAQGADMAPDGAAAFLARLSLLLAKECGDARRVEALVRAAAEAGQPAPRAPEAGAGPSPLAGSRLGGGAAQVQA
jgi:hypothetical protein